MASAEEAAAPPLLTTIFISGRAPGMPAENELTVTCERGVLRFDLHTATLTVYRAPEGGAGGPVSSSVGRALPSDGTPEVVGGGGSAWSDVGTPALGRAIAACLAGASPESSAEEGGVRLAELAGLEDGVYVQRATDAVHSSAARNGEWVGVDTTPP